MINFECRRVRETLGRSGPTLLEERHLFGCPECRGWLRLSAAWKSVPRPEEIERTEPVSEAFVAGTIESIRKDRRRRTRRRASLAAAAALLFFFLAGAAGQLASSAASNDEDAYAQLVTPSSLDAFLPE